MDQIAIGKFISRKRKEKNLTQEQLAEKLGVSNKTISKWECGKCMPDYSVIELLCSELGVTLAELMDGEEEEKSIHTYDNAQVFEMLGEMQRVKNTKQLLIGIVLTVMGIVMIFLAGSFTGSDFMDFTAGALTVFSFSEILLGVFLVARSLIEQNKK